MSEFEAEEKVYDYIVYSTLIRALDRDTRQFHELKLSRAWLQLADMLTDRLTKELTFLKNQMANHGCRIVLEEYTADHSVHVMFVHRRYEHHCYMLPYVLKSRCEDKLIELMKAERPVGKN